MAPIAHAGYITFRSKKPPLVVRVLAGSAQPTVVGGFGGWDEIQRPRRKSLVTWTGFAALQISIPIMFVADSRDPLLEPSGTEVERDINVLERMAGRGPLPGAGKDEPPTVYVTGPGSLISQKASTPWVISNLDWGDGQLNKYGYRVKQECTVTLLHKVVDTPLKNLGIANRRKPRRHPRTYTVKKGDTLGHIANKVLGDSSRWREIWNKNKKKWPDPGKKPRDKTHLPKIGTKLSMPR